MSSGIHCSESQYFNFHLKQEQRQHCICAENISDFAKKPGRPLTGGNTEGQSAWSLYLRIELDTMVAISNRFLINKCIFFITRIAITAF